MPDLVSPIMQIASNVLTNLVGKAIEDRFRPIIEEEVRKQVSDAVRQSLPLLQKQPPIQIDIGAINIAVMKEIYAIAGTSRALDVSSGSITIRPAFVTKPADDIFPAIFQSSISEVDTSISEADTSSEGTSIVPGQETRDVVRRYRELIQSSIVEEEKDQQ